MNATNPDLMAFEAHGGNLILCNRWSDSAIFPLNTMGCYKSMMTRMGHQSAPVFVRPYMVPGLRHCGNGPWLSTIGAGPSADTNPTDSMFGALEQWVERSAAPKEIIATKYAEPWNPESAVEMTRPLCSYPEVAKYKGSDDIDQAAEFGAIIDLLNLT